MTDIKGVKAKLPPINTQNLDNGQSTPHISPSTPLITVTNTDGKPVAYENMRIESPISPIGTKTVFPNLGKLFPNLEPSQEVN